MRVCVCALVFPYFSRLLAVAVVAFLLFVAAAEFPTFALLSMQHFIAH